MWTAHSEFWHNRYDPSEVYSKKFETKQGEDVLDDIRLAVNTGLVLRYENFHQQFKENSSIPQTFLMRGRPTNVSKI